MKVVWCVTGAGHLLKETVAHMAEKAGDFEVTVVFSSAGCEVAGMYGLLDKIKDCFEEVIIEKEHGTSSPFVGRLWDKEYGRVCIAPCTANTVAKMAYGIADSLVSNIAAQAGKRKIPVYVLATDSEKHEETVLPDGRTKKIECRKLDLDNLAAVSRIPGVTIVKKPEELL